MISPPLHPVVARLNPSAEQLPAILARGRDVLVSAGAGTGKTRTLTARILALLAEGVPLRAIVAVTFTIRAASEMRNRLRREVQAYLATPALPPSEVVFWSTIVAQMDAARIGTIHSLCTEILRAHPAEALLDPNFAVLDEAQALLLRRSAVEETLALLVSSAEPDDTHLLDTLGIATLREVLTSLLATDATRASSDETHTRLQAALDELAQGVVRFLREPAAADAIANLRLAFEETKRNDAAAQDAATAALAPTLEAWDAAQHHLATGETFDALVAAMPIATIARGRGNQQNWKRHNPKPHYATLLDLWAHHLALPKEGDPRADRALIALLPALLRARDHTRAACAARKAQVSALDFDDLEIQAQTLLASNESVRHRWQQEVSALLVDEFQDTNARQRDLLRAIAGDRGVLFMVGDAKQSIYRFRGADVSVFRAERTRVGAEGGESLTLDHTFRAHPPLLEQMNAMLAGAMHEDATAPADFREPFAPLLPGDAQRTPRTPAPWIEVQLALGAKGDGALENAASALAQRLLELHDAGYAWEEMALLCRRAAAFEKYEDAFERAAIPYVTVAGSGFHDRPEIRDLLNALRAIADPTDNLALFGFLRSPVIGFSDADLLALFANLPPDLVRAQTPGIWWRALGDERSPRADRAVALLQQLGALAGRATVAEVLKRFLDLTHYEAALIRTGNDRAARNLNKLLEDAQGSPQHSIPQFLATIDDLRAARSRSSEAPAETLGSVQIMTIHKAKGLEFPIVAIGDAGSRGGGRRSDLLISPTFGALLPMKQPDDRRSVLYLRAAALEKEMEDAESDRLLYVAATRAREVLIFSGVGGVNQSGEPRLDGWLKAIGAPLGIADAFASNHQNGALPTRGQTDAVDAPSSPSPLLMPLQGGATCLVTASRIDATPNRPTPAAALATPFDPRLVAPVALPPPPPDDEQRQRTRDELRRRIAPRRQQHTPHHIVGDLIHRALEQEVDPHSAAFAEWLDAHAAAHGIREQVTLRNLRKRLAQLLARYYASDLHAEVQRAVWVQREVPFALTADATPTTTPAAATAQQESLFTPAQPDAAPAPTPGATQQGVIDLLYRTPTGEWVVVDFKSDHFKRGASTLQYIETHTDYILQLRTYGRAVAQLVGATPRLSLCLLDDQGKLNLIEIT